MITNISPAQGMAMNDEVMIASRIDNVEIRHLADNIFEIIPGDTLEMTFVVTDSIYRYMLENSSGNVSILVNRRFHFSASLEVIKKHLAYPWITCWGVLCHSSRSTTLTQLVVLASGISKERVNIFSNREKALTWLKFQHYQHENQTKD